MFIKQSDSREKAQLALIKTSPMFRSNVAVIDCRKKVNNINRHQIMSAYDSNFLLFALCIKTITHHTNRPIEIHSQIQPVISV